METETIKNTFNNTEKLYHYTSFNNAIKIIINNTLLFGKLRDLNDINELYRPLSFYYHPHYSNSNNSDDYKKMEDDFYKYQQISLTEDKNNRLGFDIPAMWGHYGQHGNGICLVFSKKHLTSCLNYEKKRRHIVFDKVKYTKEYSPVVTYRTDADKKPIPFNKREEKDFFFHKTKDWSYEQEFRVIIKSNSNEREKFNFKNSLMYIIMHNAESIGHEKSIYYSTEYKTLKTITNNNIPILEHSIWFQDTQLTYYNKTIWSSSPTFSKEIILDI